MMVSLASKERINAQNTLLTVFLPGSLINGIQSTPSFKTFFNNPSGSSLGFITAAQSMGSVAVLPVVGKDCLHPQPWAHNTDASQGF